MNKFKDNRLKRAKRTRIKIHMSGKHRLCVFRSNQHIYAQIIDTSGSKIITSASTLESSIREHLTTGGDIKAAEYVGQKIAERSLALGIKALAFDRSGYKFHGRIRALAEAARNSGINI